MRFLLAGAVLAALHAGLRAPAPSAPAPVVVDAATLAALREDWARTTGRAPTDSELDAAVQDWVDRELLVRAALEHDLQHRDAQIQRRLIQNLRFLENASDDAARADDATLLAQAYALGLDRSDPVVRRRLIERMREIILAESEAGEPPAGAGAMSVGAGARIRLSHVFLSRDEHGDDLEAAARALLERLRGEHLTPDDPRMDDLGDPLPIPRHLPPQSRARLAGRLGPAFASRVFEDAPVGAWSEPIESSYGMHLVWVHERSAGDEPESRQTAGKGQAAAETRRRQEASMQRALQILRQDVDVIRYDREAPPQP